MTGRGAGYCAGFAAPGFASAWGGRGGGFGVGRTVGWGRGRGWAWRAAGPGTYPPAYPMTPMAGWYGEQPQDQEAQLDWLKSQAEVLGQTLANIQHQIEALGGKEQEEE
jgi:hypothetical protein